MFPWGAIVSLAGSAASGIMSAINNKRAKEVQDQEYARQQAEAKARAYEDPISRSENQRILNEYDRLTQRQVENQRNAGIITGETQEAALARQKAAIHGRADLMGDMAAGASANKDYYLDVADQSKRNQALAEQQRLAERNQTYANLAANAASAFGNIVDSYGTGKTNSANRNSVAPRTEAQQQNAAKLKTTSGTIAGQAITKEQAKSDLDSSVAKVMARIDAANAPLRATAQGVTVQSGIGKDQIRQSYPSRQAQTTASTYSTPNIDRTNRSYATYLAKSLAYRMGTPEHLVLRDLGKTGVDFSQSEKKKKLNTPWMTDY